MRFVIMDRSTSATAVDALGGVITQEQLQRMAAALEIQLNRDLALWWGGSHVVRVGSTVDGPQEGEVVMALVDSLPDAPTAVAYHDTDGKALPLIFCARVMCTSVLQGNSSISAAFSHEAIETVIDPACNRYADDAAGTEHALEGADAVESDSYEINGASGRDVVTVSNFLLPDFFADGSPGPWSYLGNEGHETVPGPFKTAPGGYQIERAEGGDTFQVQGKGAPHREAKRQHWSSRHSMRLAAHRERGTSREHVTIGEADVGEVPAALAKTQEVPAVPTVSAVQEPPHRWEPGVPARYRDT